MLVLLPPSEAKFRPTRGRSLELASLSFPELTQARHVILEELVRLCRADAALARQALRLPPGLADEVTRNAGLPEAATAPAGRIYTGVLYEALGLDSLSTSAKRRAASRLAVTSSTFGLLRVGDRIPAYRLSGDVTLPGLGTVAAHWRQVMDEVMRPLLAKHLVVDLRSGMYAAFWRPRPDQTSRVVSLRVLQETSGKRSVVSHFNKATKGRIVRSLLEDGSDPRSAKGFVDLLAGLGWRVEPTPEQTHSWDVIVSTV